MTRFITIVVFAVSLAAGSAQAVSLVSYWEAEGTADATVGTDGTLVNGAGFDTGKFGQGFDFNGASQQRVEVPGGGGLNGLTEGTVSMWVQWDGTQDAACCGGTAGNVLARQNNGVFSNNVLGLNNTDPAVGGVTWQPYGAGGPVVSGGTPVGDGALRHVAVSFSSGHHAVYLDGVLQGTSTATGSMANNPAVALSIGAWTGDGAGYSTSVVDDVAVWDRELSINQIQALSSETNNVLNIADPVAGVTASASSELTAGPFNRVAANVVDGVGRGTTVPDGAPGDGRGMWLSEGIGFSGGNDQDPQITFDLGAIDELEEMVVFNYNETAPNRPELLGRGVAEFDLLISDDGVGFTSLGTHSLLMGTGDGSNPGQVIPIDATGRFVRIDVLSNHNGATYPNPTGFSDFAFVGLNEVEFFAAVPEPTTAMLGMAGLAALAIRRRRTA